MGVRVEPQRGQVGAHPDTVVRIVWFRIAGGTAPGAGSEENGAGPTRAGDRLGYNGSVFFFFSNRLGCFGSLLVSVVITVALIWLLKR
jgi:hypothetical protein